MDIKCYWYYENIKELFHRFTSWYVALKPHRLLAPQTHTGNKQGVVVCIELLLKDEKVREIRECAAAAEARDVPSGP